MTDLLAKTRRYLTQTLLPFWIERSPDPEHGGFLTYFDAAGRPTGETEKTFLMQIRSLYTMASAHRAGYGDGRCAELAAEAARFVLAHYEDGEHGGWYWIADRSGRPTCLRKIGYGQCFAMYAFGEYWLATGDPAGRDAMLRTYGAVVRHMTDAEHGGYLEIFARDWRPEVERKSFDVHMHMMEALTKVVEVTGEAEHRAALQRVVDLVLARMLAPATGTGIQQLTRDFRPVPAVELDVRWGRDEDRLGGGSTPADYSSYGHDVEFAWLLLHAADALGVPRERYAGVVERICDHCVRYGVDHEMGGVYVEGPRDRPPDNRHKQFWQQAEILVGMLEAHRLVGKADYLAAFRNVHEFVFDKLVCAEGGGEWYALVDRDGTPLWDYLGDAWKINYHTVRSMVRVVALLEAEG